MYSDEWFDVFQYLTRKYHQLFKHFLQQESQLDNVIEKIIRDTEIMFLSQINREVTDKEINTFREWYGHFTLNYLPEYTLTEVEKIDKSNELFKLLIRSKRVQYFMNKLSELENTGVTKIRLEKIYSKMNVDYHNTIDRYHNLYFSRLKGIFGKHYNNLEIDIRDAANKVI